MSSLKRFHCIDVVHVGIKLHVHNCISEPGKPINISSRECITGMVYMQTHLQGIVCQQH